MSQEIKKGYVIGDQVFETNAEAQEYLRRPKILDALLAVTGRKQDVADWLLEHQEAILGAFDSGTIRRVTKSERNKLAKAFEHLATIDDSKLKFLQDNADSIVETFRWPTVKRMNDEEKAALAKNTLMLETENDEKLSEWIIANKDNILAAYDAGKVKREVNPKAMEALQAYHAQRKAEKEAAEAAA